MIRLIQVTRTVRLYGQSSYPKRINGHFTIQHGAGEMISVEIVEGHVNKAGRPQRLISFEDITRDGSISTSLKNTCVSQITIANEAEQFQFEIERVSLEVVGVADAKATDLRYRGPAEFQFDPSKEVTLYETDSPGNRRFYIDSPNEITERAMNCIFENGGVELVVRSI